MNTINKNALEKKITGRLENDRGLSLGKRRREKEIG